MTLSCLKEQYRLVSVPRIAFFLCIFCAMLLGAAIPATAADDPQPPRFRLPDFAVPQRYDVNLTVAPDQDTFSGAVDIDLNFKQASPVLWLNAKKIKIKEAILKTGGQTLTAKVITEPKDLVGFSFDHPVGPGTARLHVSYEGEISRKDMQGIFQVKDGDHWYIYSQFENISARQAFPCFDEPSYKVPWKVTLNVPKDDRAFSNTPMVSETVSGDTKTVRFAETKPLPSYLVAITVGPLDLVEASPAGAKKTAIRIIVPRGRGPEAQYVAATTPDIVNLLEKYFGIPYPYEKLDEVAIPLAGFAMEHPGMVTYGAGFFLLKPQETTLNQKRLVTSIMAHELAHQWFGDLVTTEWWEDIWLNEGFASWMANKIVNEYRPDWKMNIQEINGYQGAMGTDELVSSRKVRQPILSDDDIENAFDNITYNKGSALLNMFESYLGPPTFQARIQQYLRKYSWGNATSAQFLEVLSGGKPEVAQAFSSFLDQAGVPLITPKLDCNGGNIQLQLSQQRFLPRGSQGSSDQVWSVPVCVKYPAGAGIQRECTLLTKKTGSMSLGKAKACPAWVYPNADEAGYYRVLYGNKMLESIVSDEKTLTVEERVGLIGDIAALTESYMPLGEAMALVPKFAHESNREVITKTLSIVGDLNDHLVPEDLKPKYRRYISDLYGQRARELGWKDLPSDNDDARLLRPAMFNTVANKAEDPELIDAAKKLALQWIDDHKAIDRDMLGPILRTAARHGDRTLFDRLHAQAKKETDEDIQGTVLFAMGSFTDPAIIKTALPIILTDEFDPRQSLRILFGAASPETRDLAYDFVKQNWDALIAKLPTDSGAFLPFVAGDYCDAEHRADIEAFFKDRSTKYAGGPRNLQQVLEGVDLCIANKKANEASVAEFLRKY